MGGKGGFFSHLSPVCNDEAGTNSSHNNTNLRPRRHSDTQTQWIDWAVVGSGHFGRVETDCIKMNGDTSALTMCAVHIDEDNEGKRGRWLIKCGQDVGLGGHVWGH